jgi:beta-lactamase superfamily II metal-dependent hydrolase
MGYEIDFLPVGDKSKGGDAIALRYGDLFGSRDDQTVMIVDGGYTDDGEALVNHIGKYYKTDRVDFVVSTHPDQDHILGLKVVLENIKVGTLLMHRPWLHSRSVSEARATAFKSSGFVERVAKSLDQASELESIATRKGVKIVEPFYGVEATDKTFRILGPTKAYYEQLITAEVQAPPEAGQAAIDPWVALEKLAKRAAESKAESLNIETLRDDGVTTPTNNSSAICLLTVDDRQMLLTGDAGIPALQQAMEILETEGFQPGDFKFVQVPHHGSRRNVGPSILDRMLGPKGQTARHSVAYASVPPKNPEHIFPAKKVTNAFHRRGYNVHLTQGVTKWHHHDAPARDNYSISTPVPFHEVVEEDGDA